MSTARIDAICPECNQSFWYYKSRARTYCSKTCKLAASHKLYRIDAACPECRNVFWYYRSWPRIYCSRVCAARATVTTNLGVTLLPAKECEQCGKLITKNRQATDRFCSQKCFGAWQSQYNRAEAHHSYRERAVCVCAQCGKEFSRQRSWIDNGMQFCDRHCKATWQEANPPNRPMPVMRGPNNPRWRGGYDGYYGPNWRQQRRNARHRDNYACQRCGKTEQELGKQLDVHHIVAFREFRIDRYLEANRLVNLICYCHSCHLAVEHELDQRPNPPR